MQACRAAPDVMPFVNEPILISNGLNSDIRYNFFYPRWAYDEYRLQLTEHAAGRNWRYLDLWDLVPLMNLRTAPSILRPRVKRYWQRSPKRSNPNVK